MGLSGNLRTMDLPEILQWISIGRKTGTLHLNRKSIQKRIVFKEGVVYTSWSNDPRESLGQFLIRDGLVTEEQLFTALLDQEQQGRFLGAILVAEAILAEDELRAALRTKAVESIYDLFLWPEGQFEFKEGEFPELIHLDVPVTAVILEGVRRVDEWKRIRKIFPSANITFKIANPAYHSREPAERRALELVRSGRTLAEISLELRRSEFDAASLMFDLTARGVVAVDQILDATVGADPVGAIKDLLAIADQRFEARRYDSALEAYEEVLTLDRLNQNAKKGVLAVTEARGRERALSTVKLDKVPVLRIALVDLTRENIDPQEGFLLSRINGEWDVRSILKICPMSEESALLIFARLASRGIIDFVEVGDRR
jgi:tetratricopeptide (TPR) repeat protein